jgi:hypothetical protein
MLLPEPPDSADRLARIELMIERYRLVTLHRLRQQALALWRKTEIKQTLIKLEKPIDRVH